MNSSDRLDQLLRAELRRADDLPVESPYDAVLARSGQRTRRRRVRLAAGGLLASVGLAAGVHLVVSPPAPPPAADRPSGSLHGTWTRTVTSRDVGEGAWTLSFARPPVLGITGPSRRPSGSVTDGAAYALDGDLVRVNIFVNGVCGDLASAGTYRWTVDSGLLYLDVVQDSCAARRDLLVGTWVRERSSP
jgi:hypothetical protein